MGRRLRPVPEQGTDVAGGGLPLEELGARADVIDRVRVLPTLQHMPRPAPAVPPLLTGQSDEGLRSYHELAAASPRLSCSDSSEAFRVAGRQLSGMATLDPTTGQCGDRRSNG